jgi:hypothetical protein
MAAKRRKLSKKRVKLKHLMKQFEIAANARIRAEALGSSHKVHQAQKRIASINRQFAKLGISYFGTEY